MPFGLKQNHINLTESAEVFFFPHRPVKFVFNCSSAITEPHLDSAGPCFLHINDRTRISQQSSKKNKTVTTVAAIYKDCAGLFITSKYN